jgi:3-oxoacyl-[acyl-carrier-protein] synthase-3
MTIHDLTDHLLRRLREVQERLGADASAEAQTPFAEAVDSMGLVEFVGVVAADCGAKPDAIEQSVQRRFTTIAALARAMYAERIMPRVRSTQGTFAFAQENEPAAAPSATVWLARWRTFPPPDAQPDETFLQGAPPRLQSTEEIDPLLGRPSGWLAQHAGIRSRWSWLTEDPIEAAASVGDRCLADAAARQPATLLVTGEAPPLLLGLGAAVHHRMGLSATVPALEIGGACLGVLHSLWLASRLARPRQPALVVAVEAPMSWLTIRPGTEGEAAALFGEGAAACLVTAEPQPGALPLRELILGCDGSPPSLVEVVPRGDGVIVHMDGPALALRAVDQFAEVVRQVCERNDVRVEDLQAVYAHAGNGRMPPLIARRLDLPDDRVVSTTPFSGNLGSVSLLAALSHRPPTGAGPVVLAAVGGGLQWGAALFDAPVPG